MRRHYPTLRRQGPKVFLTFPTTFTIQQGLTPDGTTIRVILTGNPLLKPEVAYEWSYGAVYSPKWIRGLTLSADFWHIDLRSIAAIARWRNSSSIMKIIFRRM